MPWPPDASRATRCPFYVRRSQQPPPCRANAARLVKSRGRCCGDSLLDTPPVDQSAGVQLAMLVQFQVTCLGIPHPRAAAAPPLPRLGEGVGGEGHLAAMPEKVA